MSFTLTFRTPANSIFDVSTGTYSVYLTVTGSDMVAESFSQRINLGYVSVTGWDTFWRLKSHDDD